METANKLTYLSTKFFTENKKDGQVFCDMIIERIEKYEKECHMIKVS